MIVMHCPRDGAKLQAVKQGGLRSYACPDCGGRAAGMANLRRRADPARLGALWREAMGRDQLEGADCPSCGHATAEVISEGVTLDVCRLCHLLWLDPGEMGQLAGAPEGPPAAHPANEPAAPERPPPAPDDGLRRVPHPEEDLNLPDPRQREVVPVRQDGAPDGMLRSALAHVGVPFEEGLPPVRVFPVLTWVLGAASLVIFGANLGANEALAARWGLIPDEATRAAGSTFLTHALIHESGVHLALDLLLLFVFGDNVEEELGPLGFLGLAAAATVVGGVAHVLVGPSPDLALTGLTAATCAMMATYTLRFPGARLGWVFHFRRRWGWSWEHEAHWVRVPVWLVTCLFILLLVGLLNPGAGLLDGASLPAALGGLITGGLLHAWGGVYRRLEAG